jgi:hypothetical protein
MVEENKSANSVALIFFWLFEKRIDELCGWSYQTC